MSNIDSYQVTESYLTELSKDTKIAYLDDWNLFPYSVAMLICYANYWEQFDEDSYHVLDRILEQMKERKIPTIHVICGRYYEGYQEFTEKYKAYQQIHFYQSVNDMETYMSEADLAVSAGGTTLYELCACGTPTISYAFADNQLDNVRQFEKDGIIDYAGDVRCNDVVEQIVKLIDNYNWNPKLRQERSENMQQLVDGKGAERIAREWQKL